MKPRIKTKITTRRNMAYISLFMFLGVIACLMYFAFTRRVMDATVKQMLNTSLIILFGIISTMKDFYFRGSPDENELDDVPEINTGDEDTTNGQ